MSTTALVRAFIPLVPANGTEYDHVRPGLASHSPRSADILAAGSRYGRCYCGLERQMTEIALQNDANAPVAAATILARLGRRSIVLVGMMGSGKSSAGRRLAARLNIPFVDADTEIEKAAGMSIADIFARHGEADFRGGEARVIARLLDGGPQVLATGGGAFMNPATRSVIQAKGICIWLSADVEVLMRRISKRRNERPLLQTADPAETLRRLLAEREPTYAQADLTVQSRDLPHDTIVADIMKALAAFLAPAAVPEGRADP